MKMARMKRPRELLDALGSFIEVFRVAGRVLARRWPVLLALTLAGATLRAAVVWLAVMVSGWSGLAAVLVLPLAPLATLLALVLMLRVAGQDLPAFTDQFATRGRARAVQDLSVAAKVMIPFLAVYAAQGLLREDGRHYVYDATAAEVARYDILAADFGRADYSRSFALVLGLVIVVLIARKVMMQLKLNERGWGWSALGGYLEALWLVALVSYFTSQLDRLTGWVLSRQAVVDIGDWAVRSLGELGRSGQMVLDGWNWLVMTLGSMGNWIVVPVAWLAIGATIFGTELGRKADPKHPGATVVEEDRARRVAYMTAPARRVIAQVADPVAMPIRNTTDSLKRVAVAGIIPMFLFCVIFVLADQVRVLTAWLMKQVIGGRDLYERAALQPYYDLVGRSAFTVLIVVLVAAAVHVVVLAQRRRDAADAAAGV